MSETTGIEWTEATWNPWHGCHKVSPGCKNCYMYRDKARYGQHRQESSRPHTGRAHMGRDAGGAKVTGEEWLAKEQRLIEKYGKLTVGQLVELVENQEEALRASKSQIAAGCRAMLDARDAEIEKLRAALRLCEMECAIIEVLVPNSSSGQAAGRAACAAHAALNDVAGVQKVDEPGLWRVGSKVPINVYDGDRPVCQCHTAADALRIVRAVNALAPAPKL